MYYTATEQNSCKISFCATVPPNHPAFLLQINNWGSHHKERRYYRVLDHVLPEFLMGHGHRMDVMVFLPPILTPRILKICKLIKDPNNL